MRTKLTLLLLLSLSFSARAQRGGAIIGGPISGGQPSGSLTTNAVVIIGNSNYIRLLNGKGTNTTFYGPASATAGLTVNSNSFLVKEVAGFGSGVTFGQTWTNWIFGSAIDGSSVGGWLLAPSGFGIGWRDTAAVYFDPNIHGAGRGGLFLNGGPDLLLLESLYNGNPLLQIGNHTPTYGMVEFAYDDTPSTSQRAGHSKVTFWSNRYYDGTKVLYAYPGIVGRPNTNAIGDYMGDGGDYADGRLDFFAFIPQWRNPLAGFVEAPALPGRLGMSMLGTNGLVVTGRYYGEGGGLTNAVDLTAGSGISIAWAGNKRTATISSVANTAFPITAELNIVTNATQGTYMNLRTNDANNVVALEGGTVLGSPATWSLETGANGLGILNNVTTVNGSVLFNNAIRGATLADSSGTPYLDTVAGGIYDSGGSVFSIDTDNRRLYAAGSVLVADWSTGRLALGGTSSSFPALKRSTTEVHFRLADDSAFAPVFAAGATLTGISNSGSQTNVSYTKTANLETTSKISVNDGTVGTPSILFQSTDDGTATGIYKSSTSRIGFACNGVQNFYVDASGVALPTALTFGLALNGNVLIFDSNDSVKMIADFNHANTIQQGLDAATPATQYFKGPDGLGADKNGGGLIAEGGQATGTGAPGRFGTRSSFTSTTGSTTNGYAGTAFVGGTLKVNTTDVANVGAGEDDLITYSVPANQLSVNGDHLEFDVYGTIANSVNNKTIKVYFGSTAIFNTGALSGATLGANEWRCHGRIIRTSATAQEAIAEFTLQGALLGAVTTTTIDFTEPAETLSGAITFKCTGEATSNDEIVQEGMIVKWMPNGN